MTKRPRTTDEKECLDLFTAVDQYIEEWKDKAKKAKCQLSISDIESFKNGISRMGNVLCEDLEMIPIEWPLLHHVEYKITSDCEEWATGDRVIMKFKVDEKVHRLDLDVNYRVELKEVEDPDETSDVFIDRIFAIEEYFTYDYMTKLPTNWDSLPMEIRQNVGRFIISQIMTESKLKDFIDRTSLADEICDRLDIPDD